VPITYKERMPGERDSINRDRIYKDEEGGGIRREGTSGVASMRVEGLWELI